MITTVQTDSGTAVEVDLAPGHAAVFDREWVSFGQEAPVPALMFERGDDLEERAASALAGIADDAVAEAQGPAVAVTGRGFVAEAARRRLLAAGRLAPAGEPTAVIETTGDPAAIVAATQAVEALGTVVLAGEALGRVYELDLYPDVHVRGLRLVARGRVGASEGTPPDHAERPRLQTVSRGERLDPSAAWFCVLGSPDA